MVTEYSENEKFNRLRLIRTDTIGPYRFHQLIRRFGSATEALHHLSQNSRHTEGRSRIIPAELSVIESEFEDTARAGADFLYLGEENYPHLLAQLDDAPPVLTYKGDVRLAHLPCLGIVGARNASLQGGKLTARFAEVLGQSDLVIVSGLARGIDTYAHKAALETGTIAVIASGIDVIYPRENAKLHEEISSKGLLLTEMPFGAQPKAANFPRRNRIVSGLSQGVLVIEAALKSGSLITASFAAKQGREVFAVPGSPLDPRSRGANELIRRGAVLTETPDDIFFNLGPLSPDPIEDREQFSKQEPEAQTTTATIPTGNEMDDREPAAQLLSLLGASQIHLDEVSEQMSLSSAEFLGLISELEVSGKIVRLPGGLVSRV